MRTPPIPIVEELRIVATSFFHEKVVAAIQTVECGLAKTKRFHKTEENKVESLTRVETCHGFFPVYRSFPSYS